MFVAYDGTPAELKQLFRSKVPREYGTEGNLSSDRRRASRPSWCSTHKECNPRTPQAFHNLAGKPSWAPADPQVLSPDYTSNQAGDTTTQEVTRLAQVTPKVTIQTGTEFWGPMANGVPCLGLPV